MGWTFPWSTHNRKDLLEYLRRPARYGEDIEVLHSTAVGNNHWYLAKNRSTGQVWIGLDMMQGGGRTGEGWGYKPMSEDYGPCAVNCPLHFLDKASPAEGYAVGWREKVRKYHADREARPTPTAGATVEFGPYEFKLLSKAGPRLGWRVQRVSDSQIFRMNAKQLSRATFKTATAS